ncbi:MAG: hypothetical protein RXR52_29355, partial [Paraburkholderia sp.]|uniref:hypothetical protein n=1 Tax=Paraburkholderia sp. TaxID=1926495 RepID=UPI00397CF1B3
GRWAGRTHFRGFTRCGGSARSGESSCATLLIGNDKVIIACGITRVSEFKTDYSERIKSV